MTVYDADHIRNVALVGHQGTGKTTLAEAMLYASGAIPRMGAVEDGSTRSDYHESEQERGMSVFTSLLHAEWKGHKINVLDTPGYLDFSAETITALKVADTAIFVLDAAEGVQVGTELGWTYTEMTETPAMFVLNKLDGPGSDFEDALARVQQRFGHAATPVQLPGGTGTRTIIDVLLMKQIRFAPDGSQTVEPIDEAFAERAAALHNELVESIAENDEGLMELYFEKGTLSEDEMRTGLHHAMLKRQLFPIFLTVATENVGVSRLMGFIDNVCPSPAEMPPPHMASGAVHTSPEADPVAFVWRTMHEEHVGEFSFLKVYDGTLEPGMDLENASDGHGERLGQLYAINGNARDSIARLPAGDIGATVKLKSTGTGDTLRKKGSDAVIQAIEYPEPRMRLAVRAKRQGEEDKMAQGLHQLVKEDPSLLVEHDAHLGQITLGGQGQMHLDIAKYRMAHRSGVEVEFDQPRISYRETVQGESRTSYRHKKQTGGAGQFADISIIVAPLAGEEYAPPSGMKVRKTHQVTTDWGSTVELVDAIVGGVIDMQRFTGAILKGIGDALRQGPVAGYPVGDVRVVVYDGGMHPVDSNENAFKTAAKMAFRNGFREARPTILEPIVELEVKVPDAQMGDVLGDLSTRRARIQGMDADGPFQVIRAHVPEAELYRYSTTLRSLTQGRGLHRATFSAYEPMPQHVQADLATRRGADDDE
ncbi:elongation factor G [Rubricoccus marinus]|uniref:Elongation factor G n=1 Tax=Rubricoccus marinus TaxID=716817 RepID=A0A259TXM3_9BACT|nr:elongation factor G [Rubricoccus marinus]OZC02367.1 elongation factor G [Rubricoccus marinus]